MPIPTRTDDSDSRRNSVTLDKGLYERELAASEWRGEQQAILKIAIEQMREMNDRLRRVEEKAWIIEGKMIALGLLGGTTVPVAMALFGLG